EYTSPMYFMVPKDFEGIDRYSDGFQITEIFKINTSGIKTHRDAFVIDDNRNDLEHRISDFFNSEIENKIIVSKYSLKADTKWLDEKRRGKFDETTIQKISYRPFDDRWIYYSPEIVDRGRENV